MKTNISAKSIGTDTLLLVFSEENGLKYSNPVYCNTDTAFAWNFSL